MGSNQLNKPLPRMNLRICKNLPRDAFLAQIEDPLAGKLSLGEPRQLTTQIDTLRKRLLDMIDRPEPICTAEDIGGR